MMAKSASKGTSGAKDKSGFGSSKVDPKIQTPFKDAIFKK